MSIPDLPGTLYPLHNTSYLFLKVVRNSIFSSPLLLSIHPVPASPMRFTIFALYKFLCVVFMYNKFDFCVNRCAGYQRFLSIVIVRFVHVAFYHVI